MSCLVMCKCSTLTSTCLGCRERETCWSAESTLSRRLANNRKPHERAEHREESRDATYPTHKMGKQSSKRALSELQHEQKHDIGETNEEGQRTTNLEERVPKVVRKFATKINNPQKLQHQTDEEDWEQLHESPQWKRQKRRGQQQQVYEEDQLDEDKYYPISFNAVAANKAVEQITRQKQQAKAPMLHADRSSMIKRKNAKRKLTQKEEDEALRHFAKITEAENKAYTIAAKTQGEVLIDASEEQAASIEAEDIQAWLTQHVTPDGDQDAAEFQEARLVEIRQFAKHEVFSRHPVHVREVPPGTKIIRVNEMFKRKRDGRAKCRIYGLGDTTKAGIHFNDNYSALPTAVSLRALMAVAVQQNDEVKDSDVITAFLGTPLPPDVDIYVSMSRELSELYCQQFGSSGTQAGTSTPNSTTGQPGSDTRIHRLLKALPGLPQSGCLFKQRVDDAMIKFGMRMLKTDASIFRYRDSRLYLIAWVDDLFIFYPKEMETVANSLWSHLKESFDLPLWKDTTECLGMEITRNREERTLAISMQGHLMGILKAGNMENCNPVSTPVDPGFIFTAKDSPQTDEEKDKVKNMQVLYRRIVGKIGYVASWGRPDLAFVRSKLGKFVKNPGERHMSALKRVLRYIRGTVDQAIVYRAGNNDTFFVEGYFDASLADDYDSRRTTVGYVFMLCGAPISWESKLNPTLATSTNHAEYICGARAAKEAFFIKMLLTELGYHELVTPVRTFSDSAGAISIAQNPGPRSRTKHFELHLHYIQEQIKLGNMLLTHIPGVNNIADAFTKALSPAIHFKHFSKMLTATKIQAGKKNTNDKTVLLARDYNTGDDLLTWHVRLGHRNFQDVAKIIGVKVPVKIPFCRVCTEAKATRHPLGSREQLILHADRQAQVLSADVAGPFPVPSLGGAKYVLVIIDSFSRRLFISMLISPAEFLDKFRDLVHHCEAHFSKDKVVARLHTDGGTYFNSNRVADFCKNKGIVQTSSAPYTQALNGMAERSIRTLVEMVRAMLVQSKAPRRLCGEAFVYAGFVINSLPASSDKPDSRLDLWYGRREERHLRIRPFGCAAWILNASPQQDKLSSKGQLCMLVGYEDLSHCYRIATLPRFDIIRSAHVTFNESLFPCEHLNSPSAHPDMAGITNAEFIEEDNNSAADLLTRRSSRGWHPSAGALDNIVNQANFVDDLDWARGEVLWDKYE